METKTQMVPRDLNIGFQGQIYNPDTQYTYDLLKDSEADVLLSTMGFATI